MANIDLSKYGITSATEIVYNPSYELLFEEETKPELEGFDKGQVTELDTVNVWATLTGSNSIKLTLWRPAEFQRAASLTEENIFYE